jgi:hypothetical protein
MCQEKEQMFCKEFIISTMADISGIEPNESDNLYNSALNSIYTSKWRRRCFPVHLTLPRHKFVAFAEN